MNKELTALLKAMSELLSESPKISKAVERSILLAYKCGITDTWDIVGQTIGKQMDSDVFKDRG